MQMYFVCRLRLQLLKNLLRLCFSRRRAHGAVLDKVFDPGDFGRASGQEKMTTVVLAASKDAHTLAVLIEGCSETVEETSSSSQVNAKADYINRKSKPPSTSGSLFPPLPPSTNGPLHEGQRWRAE